MNKIYFYLILFFVFIFIFKPKIIINLYKKYNLDKFTDTDLLNQYKKKQIIPTIPLLRKDKRFEILDLPFCSVDFLAHYSPNSNNIINDGSKIYQDMLKPNEQKSEINNKEYGLVQVSWLKSLFMYNGKPVGLEMQFTHIDFTTGNIVKIIFPLSFTPINKKANNSLGNGSNNSLGNGSNNSSDNGSNNSLGNGSNNSLGNVSNNSSGNGSNNSFDLLLKSTKDIPIRKSGQINIGNLLHLDLCGPSKLIFNQKKMFMGKSLNGELMLIAKPQLFSRIIGTVIMDNLDDPL